ncbi:MAG: DUF370 domain-containing protein [Oscillospiraceae bacterium]|nr:DUF370 domain-containing protein [Oscillospiraceae bacterium]
MENLVKQEYISEGESSCFALHLGADVSVHTDDVIGIFDIERLTENEISGGEAERFLRNSQKAKQIYYVSLDLPKSFVVTDEIVYITNVSTLTLKKRCNAKCSVTPQGKAHEEQALPA